MLSNHGSVLKWAGGKRWFLASLKPWLDPSHTTLVEPFVGGASLFLNTAYRAYHLADINPDLIELYLQLKHDAPAFLREARPYFSGKFNHRQAYLELRTRFNALPQGLHRSILLLYLNRHGYNGLCRYNQSGNYNVPFGLHCAPHFPERQILHFSEQAQRADFYCESFEASFARTAEWRKTTLYCDPPYVHKRGSRGFTQYHTGGFSAEQHEKLAEHLISWSQGNERLALISNHDTEATRRWYRGAEKLLAFAAPRRISCRAKERRQASELLAIYSRRSAH